MGELRAALPLGITALGLAPSVAYLMSVLGNLIPVAFIWWLFPRVVTYAENHSPRLEHLINTHLHKLSIKHKDRFQKYGALALLLFVAIPLPGSGVWTGSVLAILFNLDRARAVKAVVVGVLVAGLVVLLITEGALLALV